MAQQKHIDATSSITTVKDGSTVVICLTDHVLDYDGGFHCTCYWTVCNDDGKTLKKGLSMSNDVYKAKRNAMKNARRWAYKYIRGEKGNYFPCPTCGGKIRRTSND